MENIDRHDLLNDANNKSIYHKKYKYDKTKTKTKTQSELSLHDVLKKILTNRLICIKLSKSQGYCLFGIVHEIDDKFIIKLEEIKQNIFAKKQNKLVKLFKPYNKMFPIFKEARETNLNEYQGRINAAKAIAKATGLNEKVLDRDAEGQPEFLKSKYDTVEKHKKMEIYSDELNLNYTNGNISIYLINKTNLGTIKHHITYEAISGWINTTARLYGLCIIRNLLYHSGIKFDEESLECDKKCNIKI